MSAAPADGGDGQLRELPAIELSNLGRRDMVLLAQPFEEAADDLAF